MPTVKRKVPTSHGVAGAETRSRLYIYDGERVLYEKIKATSGDVAELNRRSFSASNLFSHLVSEAALNTGLQVELKKFYLKHFNFFERARKSANRISLKVPTEIAALADKLAFEISETGNVSLLYRLLLHHHARQIGAEKELPLSKRGPQKSETSLNHYAPPKLDISEIDRRSDRTKPHLNMAKAFSLDQTALDDIKLLVRIFQTKKLSLLRRLIEITASDAKSFEKIRSYYENTFDQERLKARTVNVRFNTNKQLDALHEYCSFKIFGTSERKRSLTLRILVGYYANKYKPAKSIRDASRRP